MDVAYGANGQFNYRYGVTGGIDCNNGTFGDPIPGVIKACYTKDSGDDDGPPGYTFCSNEYERCSFSGTMDVAYGANGQFNYRYGVTGGIDCNNGTFGDPIPGVIKACYTKDSSGGATAKQEVDGSFWPGIGAETPTPMPTVTGSPPPTTPTPMSTVTPPPTATLAATPTATPPTPTDTVTPPTSLIYLPLIVKSYP
jgi:hypothetical protein